MMIQAGTPSQTGYSAVATYLVTLLSTPTQTQCTSVSSTAGSSAVLHAIVTIYQAMLYHAMAWYCSIDNSSSGV
ncbi:hypothetical protein GGS26DRAFT_567260 [Hypomontagnella submonticulosa]|nr:hypothetical protein GGS26DRAFT_567260 [Hypomontagnella submonticulosa]